MTWEGVPCPAGESNNVQSKAITHKPRVISQRVVATLNNYNESQAETPSLAGCCLGLKNCFRINKTKPEAITLAADFSPPTQALHRDPLQALKSKQLLSIRDIWHGGSDWVHSYGWVGIFILIQIMELACWVGENYSFPRLPPSPLPLHFLIFNILPLLYDWCITHNQLLRWLLLGNRRELFTFQRWES